MSIFSPAERCISRTLPSSSSSISDSFIHRRSSSTSTSIPTSAMCATCSCGVMKVLPLALQIDRLLHDVVFGRDHLGVRLIPTLVREQIRKLLSDIYRRGLKRASDNL